MADKTSLSINGRPAVVLAWLAALTLAAYPVVAVTAHNVASYPTNGLIVIRALAVTSAATSLALALLRFLGWDSLARAAWLGLWLFLLDFYFIVPTVLLREQRLFGGRPWVAIAYVAAAAVASTLTVRPWQRRDRRDPIPLAIVAVALLATNVVPIVRTLMTPRPAWEPIVTRMTSVEAPSDRPEPERDVYFIVLDSFGRPDVIGERFGVDLSGFISSLRDAGFYVPAQSHSNYSQTFLSIASMVNMAYLDDLATTIGENGFDRRPLKKLIDENALMRLAKGAGYRVVAIGSDYTATDGFAVADVCVCGYGAPHELEFAALSLTPAADLGLDYWIAATRRQKVVQSFAAIEHARALPGRKFVVAHLLSPHPPFVFDRNGNERTPSRAAPFINGEWLDPTVRDHPGTRGEYATGYAEQVKFVAARLLELLRALSDGNGPVPAVVIVGDHGSALQLDAQDPKRSDMRERMSIFSAYRLPGGRDVALYPTISPINGARALASRYFGAAMAQLPERSLFSTFDRPYSFVPVEFTAPEASN